MSFLLACILFCCHVVLGFGRTPRTIIRARKGKSQKAEQGRGVVGARSPPQENTIIYVKERNRSGAILFFDSVCLWMYNCCLFLFVLLFIFSSGCLAVVRRFVLFLLFWHVKCYWLKSLHFLLFVFGLVDNVMIANNSKSCSHHPCCKLFFNWQCCSSI